jgi:23S rRNA pseudouridine2457 synthase
LILTDDGKLIHELTDPDYRLPKAYLGQVEGQATADAFYQLERSITYQSRKTKPSQVAQIPDPALPYRQKAVTLNRETSWLRWC